MTISSSKLLSITACTLFWGVSAGVADDSVRLKHHALVIAAKGGDRAQSDEVALLVVATVDLLRQAGFQQENMQIFSEGSATGKRSYAEITRQGVLDHLARLAEELTGDDELWVFIYGHANVNKRGLSIYTSGSRLRGQELAQALDRVQAQQRVFCLNRQSSVLLKLLADKKRVVITATNSAQQLNPPLFGKYLLEAWSKDPSAPLLSVLRDAGIKTQDHYISGGLVYAECAQAHDGEALRSMPFDGLDDGPLAKLRLSIAQDDKIRLYEVGRKVSDFADEPDMSTPESAYAAINRVLVGEQTSGWQSVSVARLAERLSSSNRAKMSAEQAKRWLDAEILQVRTFRRKYALVLSRLATSGTQQPQFDGRRVEFEGGRWLNVGHGIFKSKDQAIEKFALFCSRHMARPKRQPIEEPDAYLKPFTAFLRQHSRKPKEFILEALASHKLVVIGEVHHRPAYWALNSAIVQDSQFAKSTAVVYLELPSNNQHLVDAFLADAKLNTRPIIEMLRDNLWMGWPDQAMLEFFVAVWQTNQALPLDKHIRVVLVDMQRPWKKIRQRSDWRAYDVDRNKLMSELILKDLLESPDKRNALFIVGFGHAAEDMKTPLGEYPFRTANWYLRKELGDGLYTFLQHGPVMTNWGRVDGRVGLGLFDSAFAELNYAPIAFEIDGSPFGKLDFRAQPEMLFRGTYEDAFDGYIFLKPLEDESFSSLIEGFYTDKFVMELDRRQQLMNGRGLIEGLGLAKADAENFIAWMSRSWGKPRKWRSLLGPITAWHDGDYQKKATPSKMSNPGSSSSIRTKR